MIFNEMTVKDWFYATSYKIATAASCAVAAASTFILIKERTRDRLRLVRGVKGTRFIPLFLPDEYCNQITLFNIYLPL